MRADLEIICDWIQRGSSVLDLGCGDGTLLQHLTRQGTVRVLGLERDDANVVRCVQNGVDVLQVDLSDGLESYFNDGMFDYVVMTQTLQALSNPVKLLNEMLRVGNESIITFPNMGHWRSRLQLMLRGKMPVTPALPAMWYNTENIHLCTVKDFEELCAAHKIRILERAAVDRTHHTAIGLRLVPNWLGEIAMYRLTRG